ncbi:leucyl aminopeptidase (aminopeptidase T) [Lachnospiraceae bacterium PF1-21]|uniref:Peptidase n=1 Tax=Ohessyouella blattaphilus TaxID=2949333 RepID=A0ABT1EHJ2_9FIRM|nr:peptidase [Ohessyouella blattaphilus]MCP1108767.1 peptidase [Ohessyouella blattaphilus]MCR8562161.1 peptidase [Ohessyouella blattaphilus]MDL2250540.1 peptidase [Lachnospiraceae bacterium OttesenSCG-928-J05]
MKQSMERIKTGANIVIKSWMRLKPWENLLIVTSNQYIKEAQLLKQCAAKRGARADLMIVERTGKQVGVFFDEQEDIFRGYKAIIGATDYSIVTTKAAKKAIERGSKFLSLPLLTGDGRSLLGYRFLQMDTKKSKMMAQVIMSYLDEGSTIDVRTSAGTSLKFYTRNRSAGFFNGVVKDGGGYSSASIEAYVPIEETMTKGTMVVDGSLGYIGGVKEAVQVELAAGRITQIADNEDGQRLQAYIEQYTDEGMYVASELGIGLNSYAKCRGSSYIEDESAYGTFHIGFGRNLALGGVHQASGHFDIVGRDPDIYVDNRMIMERGKIIVPEPQVY